MFIFSKLYFRQLMAMAPAYLIMVSGGMFLSYGVFNIIAGYQSLSIGISTTALFFLLGSFHIGVIFGAAVTSFYYNLIEIYRIHLVNSTLMVISSIILIALPESYIGVLCSRLIFGIGFGSSYIKFIIYGSEISSPKVRAQILSLLHLFLTLGMFVFSIFCLSSNFSLIMRLTGSISLAVILASTALGYLNLISSHIFLMQNNSKDALERFEFFQQDSTDNPHVESETMLSFIIEEKKRRWDFFGRHNVSALLVILLVEFGYLSVFNALHNFYRTVLLGVYLTVSSTSYTPMIMMGTRLCGCVTGFFLLDNVTKRLQYFIPTVMISILLFIFGTLQQVYQQSLYIWTPMIFFVPLEFFLGIGLSPIADILKGELFPLKEKSTSIAMIIVFSEAIQIICIILLNTWILSLGSVPRNLSFIFGAITLACGIAVLLTLKDSRQQSLRLVSRLYLDK